MTTLQDGEGMGLEPFHFGGKTCYGHTGGSGSSGAWLAYCPDEKLALAYASNAKVYPVKDIVSGAMDIYANRHFTPPSFESFAVAPELLDAYAGVYVIPGTPARIVIARTGASLTFQPPNSPAVTLEATTANTFKLEPFLSVEFDTAKQEMTVTRAGQKRLFSKQP
jgi:CubicO group peptidase (beta-lactamase class C family)